MEGIKLNIGAGLAGKTELPDYTTVDADESTKPDWVARCWDLPWEDQSAIAVESRHLFEHLTLMEAKQTMAEWSRVLRKGGTLTIECPDMSKCLMMIQSQEPEQLKFGLMGLYGDPAGILGMSRYNSFQQHKWAWNPETLSQLMEFYDFVDIKLEPVVQDWRCRGKYDRDMRLKGIKA